MPLRVNLRHLAVREVALKGELPVAELDLESRDEMVRVSRPLQYDLVAERVNESLLIRGHLRIVLDCQCVRCLRPFEHEIVLTGLLCEIPLQGEEAVAVVNDCVDLTPLLRDDILLEFPPHPLCKPDCGGLSVKTPEGLPRTGAVERGGGTPSVWDELNKLKY